MVILTCGLHDPQAGLFWSARKHLRILFDIFPEVIVTASPQTDLAFLDWLAEQGCTVYRRKKNAIASSYLASIKHGQATGAQSIFYCDADRALHWARAYPQELKRVMKKAALVDYFIGMRGPREYGSHHDALRYTEQLPNAIISQAMGEKKQRDYLSGCYGFSQAAATYIVKYLKAKDFSLFGEWPLRLKKQGFLPTYQVCKGLEWETPDQHLDEVTRCGGVEAYRAQLSSPEEWKKRATMAQEFVSTLIPKP